MIAIRMDGEATTVTLSLALRDHPRVDLASREAVALADRHYVGKVLPPLGLRDGSPVLTVTVPKLPDALVPGATLNLRIGLRVDLQADPMTVEAVATRLEAIQPPPVAGPVITLPPVTLGPPPVIEGLSDCPVQQGKAEAFLRAAHAFQARRRAIA